jgi:hypothetical protein
MCCSNNRWNYLAAAISEVIIIMLLSPPHPTDEYWIEFTLSYVVTQVC